MLQQDVFKLLWLLGINASYKPVYLFNKVYLMHDSNCGCEDVAS